MEELGAEALKYSNCKRNEATCRTRVGGVILQGPSYSIRLHFTELGRVLLANALLNRGWFY